MIDEARIIGGLVFLLLLSYAAFFGWLVTGIRGLRRDVDDVRAEMIALNRERQLEFNRCMDRVETRLDTLTRALLPVTGKREEGAQ